mgnify:CR=1 FL=1
MTFNVNILDDSTLWVAISFIVFLILVYGPLKKMIIDSLDKKILELKSHLDDSKKLKKEAEELFNEHILKDKENVVKVVEVTDDSVTDDKFAMSHRERLEYGEKMLKCGRMLYQTKRYRRAKLMWDKGADVFSLRKPQGEFDKDGEKKNKESFQVAHKIYNNLAMLHLKMVQLQSI